MAHPLWLLGLFPWMALTLYLLLGRRRELLVPYLALWPKFESPSTTRNFHPPPPAIIAALAAIALSILAAAGPQWPILGASNRPITLIIDRGFTMSARDGAVRRFQSLPAAAAPTILQDLGPGPAELILIPGSGAYPADRADWVSELKQMGPTALATQSAVAQAARTALLNPRAIVILFSDQKIDVTDERLVQISPTRRIENVGISDLSIRLTPSPQAMVRLINDSPLRQTTLRVSGADPLVVDLPAAGNRRDYFVNLKNPPNIIQATIDPGGDIDADDSVWAVRGSAWPTLIAPIPLPPELQRMVEVYTHNRPSPSESKTVWITDFNSQLRPDEIAVLIPTAADLRGPPPQSVQTQSSPLTGGLNWPRILRDAQTTPTQPGADWTPLVRAGEHILLAIHQDAPRQVWIGFSSPTWSATPDYVIFWTKVFDWLGQGSDQFTSAPLGALGPQWKPLDPQTSPADVGLWPGLYRRGDQTIAVNCAPISIDPATPTDWQKQLTKLRAVSPESTATLAPWLLLAAIGCLFVSGTIWKTCA